MKFATRLPYLFIALASIAGLQHGAVPAAGAQTQPPGSHQESAIDLPSGKLLLPPAPGSPVKLNSLPVAMVFSPDGHYAATLNAGFGTAESNYQQSISIIDLQHGTVKDFPDAHTDLHTAQTFFAGLAFGLDGKHLYASLDSLTSPQGAKNTTGNAIAVYGFDSAGPTLTLERLISIPLQQLAPGKSQNPMNPDVPRGKAIPYPAGICIAPWPQGPQSATASERLLIADNLSDDVLLLDASTGKVLTRFDLSQTKTVPSAYPIAVVASPDGSRAYVALWNSSEIAELDLNTRATTGPQYPVSGKVLRVLPILKPASNTVNGSHPAALLLDPTGQTLYVALANRDMVAAVDTRTFQYFRLFDTKLPGQSYFGAVPDALALSPDGRRLYVANASSDAVAVFDTRSAAGSRRAGSPPSAQSRRVVSPLGFIPTEWYPTALGIHVNTLLVATAKGKGTGPNNMPQPVIPGSPMGHSPSTYIPTLLYGSLAKVDLGAAEAHLAQLTSEVTRSNRMRSGEETVPFSGLQRPGTNPIRHVIYIIKENRTYDQIFGDISAADGDPRLTMYGRAITPNLHKLAEQFGILDNFYDSGEVSGDGHVWSNAAITSDYTEKTWQQSYRGRERSYDYEGIVSQGFPLLQGIPDVNEPASGYLWTNLAQHGKSYYHFGEYIATRFCGAPAEDTPPPTSPTEGTPEPGPAPCARSAIRRGEPIPPNYGGGVSEYPWPIPLIAENIATKPELQGHFDPQYPDFNLSFPDQLRVEEFLNKFQAWTEARKNGKDEMPEFIQLRLPNDHTAGTRPGSPKPAASVADNDLAVGRAVDAISHSPYWDDTAFFILEDDAQNGADHVDAHRSIMLVVSKYSPRSSTPAKPFVDHSFYTTVSAVRTMERLLGLPPMNNNDAFAPLMSPLFSGGGDQPPFTADASNRENGLIYQPNTSHSPGARESAKMDFTHADQADSGKLNAILWREAKGSEPMPASLRHPATARKDDDD